jgi:hypothetical protein
MSQLEQKLLSQLDEKLLDQLTQIKNAISKK